MMSSQSTTVADVDAAKKRKRDKEERHERRVRKKLKSKSKTNLKANDNQISKVGSPEPSAVQSLVLAPTDPDSNDLTMAQRRAARVEGPSASWKVSKPIGGRMLDIDPIFSADEE